MCYVLRMNPTRGNNKKGRGWVVRKGIFEEVAYKFRTRRCGGNSSKHSGAKDVLGPGGSLCKGPRQERPVMLEELKDAQCG